MMDKEWATGLRFQRLSLDGFSCCSGVLFQRMLAWMIQVIRSEAQESPSRAEEGAVLTSQAGLCPVEKAKQAS